MPPAGVDKFKSCGSIGYKLTILVADQLVVFFIVYKSTADGK